ncbi:MAG: endonuclease III domain-containing protein [Methanobrevibacter sp.]|jgi:endonuclease-3 related protein|nr:endonuclease III domain-containing protein [Candidatus Methanovirga meridionalis]
MNSIGKIYTILLKEYSYQGWWPLIHHDNINPNKTGAINGYHPKDYSFPKNEEERFEIILGSILTQNTSWVHVEKALFNINKIAIDFKPENILKILNEDFDSFKEAIRCTGYYNQKINYISNILDFYIEINDKIPTRKELLKVKGVGNETADSILLYAYKQVEFIVDAYTKRIFSYLNHIKEKDSYLKIKELFEENLPSNYKIYQEYHALIVEHGKKHYMKKPYGINDNLLKNFKVELI